MKQKLLFLLVLLLTATTGAWAQEPAKYKVTLQEGTEDATNWTIPAEAAEGTTVTATYSGTRKVKSVKAVKKASAYAANEYNEGSWDGTKVVFTKQTAASVTAVANSDAAVTWSAGWYTVSGNVTINGDVNLAADTHLILQDGAKLTINGKINAYYPAIGRNLYIYGQKKGDGKLNVTNSSGVAIKTGESFTAGKIVEIHGGEITVKATDDYSLGIYSSGINVYGGKLTAESNATMGIKFGKDGGGNNFKVYGGEVYATSFKTTGTGDPHGISGTDTANDVLMVYGGKVNGTGSTGGQGFKCKLWSATTGIKFYFSDNGTDWDAGTYYEAATTAPTNRYAKAE